MKALSRYTYSVQKFTFINVYILYVVLLKQRCTCVFYKKQQRILWYCDQYY